MDKVFSTRLNEDLIRKVKILEARKSISKKMLVEQALRNYINKMDKYLDHDIIDRSFGSWKRDEKIERTISEAKKTFRAYFEGREMIGSTRL